MEEKSKDIKRATGRREGGVPMSQMEVGRVRSTSNFSRDENFGPKSSSSEWVTLSGTSKGSSSLRLRTGGSSAGHSYSRNYVSSRATGRESGWRSQRPASTVWSGNDAQPREDFVSSRSKMSRDELEQRSRAREHAREGFDDSDQASWIDTLWNETKRAKQGVKKAITSSNFGWGDTKRKVAGGSFEKRVPKTAEHKPRSMADFTVGVNSSKRVMQLETAIDVTTNEADPLVAQAEERSGRREKFLRSAEKAKKRAKEAETEKNIAAEYDRNEALRGKSLSQETDFDIDERDYEEREPARADEYFDDHKEQELGDNRSGGRALGDIYERTSSRHLVGNFEQVSNKKSKQRRIGFSEDEDYEELDEFDLEQDEKLRSKERRRVEKAANKKAAKLYDKNGKKRSFLSRHKAALALASLFVIAAGVVYFWGDSIVSSITGGKSGFFDVVRSAITSGQKLKEDKNGRTNVLIYGTSGYDMDGSEGDSTHDGSYLTDSIMVLSLNQDEKDVALVNVPRDVYTNTCGSNKINEVWWCANQDMNNEQAGADALMKRVGQVYGLDFQYYAHINWMSLIKIVDAIGGITVTSDVDIADDQFTQIHVAAGETMQLDGAKALALARARYGTTYGDFTRGMSQQKILIAIKDKIVQNGLDAGQVVSLANTLGDNLRTNCSTDDIAAAAKLLLEIPDGSIRQIPVVGDDISYFTTGWIDGVSYVYPSAGIQNYEQVQDYIKTQLSADATKREDAKILVLNGSGIAGAAANEQAELTSAGFNSPSIDDAPAGDWFGKIYLYSTGSNKPLSLEKLQTYYGQTAATEIPAGVNYYGYDFVVVLGVQYKIDADNETVNANE